MLSFMIPSKTFSSMMSCAISRLTHFMPYQGKCVCTNSSTTSLTLAVSIGSLLISILTPPFSFKTKEFIRSLRPLLFSSTLALALSCLVWPPLQQYGLADSAIYSSCLAHIVLGEMMRHVVPFCYSHYHPRHSCLFFPIVLMEGGQYFFHWAFPLGVC